VVNPVDFVLLQKRLLAEIRARVRNGEMTERSLARATGMSQPHIHNVLKGTRSLSLGSSDRLLRRLGLDLADLLAGTTAPCERSQNDCRLVPVLDGPIGQGFPFPATVGRHLYPFSAADVDSLPDPVAARLAPAAGIPTAKSTWPWIWGGPARSVWPARKAYACGTHKESGSGWTSRAARRGKWCGRGCG